MQIYFCADPKRHAHGKVCLWLYRTMRNRPQRMLERFVRTTSKLPEVRLISVRNNQASVIVDQAVAPLYRRINDGINRCNRKLFLGQPLKFRFGTMFLSKS